MKLKETLLIIILIGSIAVYGAPQDEVNLLRWGGPEGTKPGTFREWIEEHPYNNQFKVNVGYVSGYRDRKVAIFTEESIATSLDEEINHLISELQNEGFSVYNYTLQGGTPDSLKNLLKSLYSTDSIEGALFIGDLPIAWYQVKNDFNSYGYAEWPVDLFYMDMDGQWVDNLEYDPNDTLVSGSDSIYDGHSGDVGPEIYVGRLLPTGMGDDTLLLQNYFRKDSAYRDGGIELQHRALVYVDDDWEYWANSWGGDVAILYDDTLLISDPETTRAVDYRPRLDTVRAWVSLFAHSWPGGHQFIYNNYSSYDYYYSNEYNDQNPPSNFYNFFCCSFCRYTTSGYGGGMSIFNPDYGVGAIGSTKTGSMLEFTPFYTTLSQEKNLGEAFRDWFDYIAAGGFSHNELCWHYGMTLLGDPFLKPTGHASGVDITDKNGKNIRLSINYASERAVQVAYSLSSDAFVDLKLFDVSGRIIKKVLSGFKTAGDYLIRVKTDELQDGIYIVKLRAGKKNSSKSIIVIR